MDYKESIKYFIESSNHKFNLDNKIEFIALVDELEIKYDITINDDFLNQVTKVQDLIDEVDKAIKAKI
jgi:hypothetical protein